MTSATMWLVGRREAIGSGRVPLLWPVVLLLCALSPAWGQVAIVEGTPGDLPDTAFDEGGCARGTLGAPSWALNLATLQLSVEAVDYRSHGLGPQVNLRRVHSASQGRAGLFGSVWRSDYEVRVTRSHGSATLERAGAQPLSFSGELWDSAAGAWRTTDLVMTNQGTSHHRLKFVAAGPAFVLDDPATRWLWRFEPVDQTEFFRLASIADRHGNAIRLTYSSPGEQALLLNVTDASSRVTIFAHDGAGRVQAITAPDSRRATFSYDALGRLVESVDLLGTRVAYTYDGADPRITSITLGTRITSFEWTPGPSRLVSAVVDPSLARTTYAFDPANTRTTITSPLGFPRYVEHTDGLRRRETDGWWREVRTEYTGGRPTRVLDGALDVRFEYDADGNLSRRTEVLPPSNRVTTLTWNADRLLTSYTDATGATWRYDYDDKLNLVGITTPQLARTTYTYDTYGQLQRETDGQGRQRVLTWDVRGSLLNLRDRASRLWSFTYDDRNGRLQTLRARDGGEPIELGYDALDRVTSLSWGGGVRRVSYDACAAVSATDENGATTSIARDARFRHLSVTDGAGGVTRFERDIDGLLTAVRDPLDHVSRASLGRESRTIQLSEANGGQWRTEYDVRGRLLGLTSPGGGVSYQVWNLLGELTALQDPLGHVERYDRDPLGRVEALVTGANRRAVFGYDGDGRRVQVTHDGAVTHRTIYDALGQALERDDSGQAIDYTYDAEGRVATATWRNGALQARFNWDLGGRLGSIVYPGGLTVSYAYDGRERLRTVSVGGALSTLSYDPADRLTTIARPNGITSAFQWDGAGRAVRVEHRSSTAGVLVDLSLTRDAAGNVLAANGLEPMPRGAQLAMPFTAYNLAGQITTRGTDVYTYGPAGDLTAVAGASPMTAQYDPQHRLISLARNGQLVTFAWDADGRRIARETSGLRRDFHYGPDGLLLFESENGLLRRSYVYADGRLFAVVEDGVLHYFHFDHLGSTLALTDTAGVVVGAWGYGPSGRVTARAGSPAVRFTFVGEFGVQDEGGGLFVMGPRVYDALTVRFLQRHPGGLAAGPRPYEYAAGNPTTVIAPSGLEAVVPTATMVSGGGAAAIERMLRTHQAYGRFAPALDLARRAGRTQSAIERMVGVQRHWTLPWQLPPTSPHDPWATWGVLR